MIKTESFVLEKHLYSWGYKETCSPTIAGLQMKRYYMRNSFTGALQGF